jgi:hypothetical protein
MIQLNRNPVNIITNYVITEGIMIYTSLVIIDLNKANLKLTNIVNYLS